MSFGENVSAETNETIEYMPKCFRSHSVYQHYQSSFKSFCDNRYSHLSDAQRYLVDEDKLYTFLRDYPSGQMPKIDSKHGVSDISKLNYMKVAVLKLWRVQYAAGTNNNTYPGEAHGRVDELLKTLGRVQNQRHVMAEFTSNDLLHCSRTLLYQAAAGSSAAVTSRLSLIMAESFAMDGGGLQDIKLSDLSCELLPDEGDQLCFSMSLTSSRPHLESFRLKHVMGALRHSDWHVCSHNALAMHCFWRWHMKKETPPDLATFKKWSCFQLFTDGQTNETSLDPAAHLNMVKDVFSACGIRLDPGTHLHRLSRDRQLPLNGMATIPLDATGCGTKDSPRLRFSEFLPLKLMRTLAGFDRAGGQFSLSRALPEPPETLINQIHFWLGPVETHNRITQSFYFLLRYLRMVLLQDMILVFKEYPDHPFRREMPFYGDEFKRWESDVNADNGGLEDPTSLQHQAAEVEHTIDGTLTLPQNESSTDSSLQDKQYALTSSPLGPSNTLGSSTTDFHMSTECQTLAGMTSATTDLNAVKPQPSQRSISVQTINGILLGEEEAQKLKQRIAELEGIVNRQWDQYNLQKSNDQRATEESLSQQELATQTLQSTLATLQAQSHEDAVILQKQVAVLLGDLETATSALAKRVSTDPSIESTHFDPANQFSEPDSDGESGLLKVYD